MKYPNDWTETTLGKSVQIARGASPRPIEAFLTTSIDGVNWIKIGDAPKEGKYITHTAEKITVMYEETGAFIPAARPRRQTAVP